MTSELLSATSQPDGLGAQRPSERPQPPCPLVQAESPARRLQGGGGGIASGPAFGSDGGAGGPGGGEAFEKKEAERDIPPAGGPGGGEAYEKQGESEREIPPVRQRERRTVVYENLLELICCVSKVPEVLNELVGDVLNRAQYKDIMSEPTDMLRMQKLLEQVLVGNERYEVRFYRVLEKTNRSLMNKLFATAEEEKKEVDKESQLEKYSIGSSAFTCEASMDEWTLENCMSFEMWPPFKPNRDPSLKTLLEFPGRPRCFPGDFAGEYGFELALQELQTMRPETCQYSQILNRLYCLKGEPCPVPMKVSSPPPPGSIVRANTVPLREKAEGHPTGVVPPEHVIQEEGNPRPWYNFDLRTTKHNAVFVPFESPKAGSAYTTILYKFMCRCDCVPCTCWHCLLIEITLQSVTGYILGRGSFRVRVSSMPKLDLMRDEEKALEGRTVVCENQLELIRCVSKVPEVLSELVGDVLNRAQYKDIMSEPTNVLRMQKLLEQVLVGNERDQVRFYGLLQKTNRSLMNKLFGGHFLERHQKQLIEKVSGMDTILPRLLGVVLNDDDYRRIRTEKTDAGMMAKLLELMPGWDRAQKDQLYRELVETNAPLITSLEATAEEEKEEVEKESRLKKYNIGSSAFRSEEGHFVERHQEELIRCAVGVDVVVESLEVGAVITCHQMQDIRGTSQQQMQKLYELMPTWTTSQKDQMGEILRCTNRRLIMQLKGGHFVDRHWEELIELVTKVPLTQLRGRALSEEQYETLLNCATEKMQMEALFQMVQKWNRQQKDQLYKALVETNPDVVKVLEEEHFIEKHEEEVIRRACRVDTVLRWLHDPHLQRHFHHRSPIKAYSDQRKMHDLYSQVRNWNRKQKDHLYAVLKKTNGALIADLEEGHFVERHKEYLMKNSIGVRTVASSLWKMFTICHHLYGDILRKGTTKEIMETIYAMVPGWNGEQKNRLYRALRSRNASLIKELESRKSIKDGLIPSWLADKCCLCEKEKDFSAVQPELVRDAEGKLKTYRIRLPTAGTFLCSITDLKFEVKAAVTIEYAHRSWDQHLSMAEMRTWMVASPLFDIRTDAEEKVAAVHLPHFLCLGGGETDISQMKIAHFVEAGLTLEKPARVTLFHAVLENPKFSLLGVLINKFFSRCVHAVVILYQILRSTITLNLYLVPNDSSLIQAIREDEEKFHSVQVQKPPQTRMPLPFGSYYTLSSSAARSIIPQYQKLHFTYMNPTQKQSYVQINIRSAEIVDLSLKKKEDIDPVWDTLLVPEDLLTLTSPTESTPNNLPSASASMQIEEGQRGPQEPTSEEPHFIDRHRTELIERTSTVAAVLDQLPRSILNDEQYERVVSQSTDPDKMRELYSLMRSWDRHCKNQLYEALRKKNPYLIADLERRSARSV